MLCAKVGFFPSTQKLFASSVHSISYEKSHLASFSFFIFISLRGSYNFLADHVTLE